MHWKYTGNWREFHLVSSLLFRIADALKDESGATNLKITQRLRLDQNKLDDVTKRMGNSSSHAVFLGLSTSTQIQHDSPDVQSRPLRNLISYLKQKEAAGVISMNYKVSQDFSVYFQCFFDGFKHLAHGHNIGGL